VDVNTVQSNNKAVIQASINGVSGATLQTTGDWQQAKFVWNSGDNTTALLNLVDLSTSLPENDFAIDKISFAVAATSNHAPVASDISASSNEDTNVPPVKLTVLFSDPDTNDTFSFSKDDTSTLGKVTNNNDGTFTYDPNGKFEKLGAGETATDTFLYTVTDNHGASSTATATVTIHGENDAPVAIPDTASVQIGGPPSTGNVRSNDSDPDIHDTLHVTAITFGSTTRAVTSVGPTTIPGTFGSLTINADGSYSYKTTGKNPDKTFLHTPSTTVTMAMRCHH
jgi:VCBS repeat-containing protein